MGKWIFAFALVCGLSLAAASHALWEHPSHLCEGFVPQNSHFIPPGLKSRGGISEAEFNQVLDRIQKMYVGEVAGHGGKLKINRRWTDGTVNASAQQLGSDWVINMYGGLARHEAVSKDGFALVACHEMGHHLAGAPKVNGWFGNTWASNEGASDYYATLKCLRRMFERDDNEAVLASMVVDPLAVANCEEQHVGRDQQLLCIRGTMAGASVAALFQDLRKETVKARLDTPDSKRVAKTDDRHPASQCRLDTYHSGALCPVAVVHSLDNEDYHQGSCGDPIRYKLGLRPRCWFKPQEADYDLRQDAEKLRVREVQPPTLTFTEEAAHF